MKEAMFYETTENKIVKCRLCPFNCVIKSGNTGVCGVRKNIDGKLFSINYGKITSAAMDPVEKKPLYHFHPGAEILSFGTFGCNFKCPFCQNWEISQTQPPTQTVTPESILEMCLDKKIKLVAFTYNEPVIWYEFVYDTAKLLKEHNIESVLVTNGFINKEPLKQLLPYISAANIDLKSFSDDFYKKIVKAALNPVLDTIKTMFESGIHIELTTLVITGENDSLNEIGAEAKWISSALDRTVPLHLSRYFPQYKMANPATPMDTLQKMYRKAKEYLDFVYVGNIWDEKLNNTYCPKCGNLLIRRVGYSTEIIGLNNGRCSKCGFGVGP